jgi:L-ascorbate metabolism protein UlaG (beta-lactamase superfamily)
MTFKITKFVHSCLMVETPDRVALFDPGSMSTSSIDVDSINRLDDILVTHIHQDHIDVNLIKDLVAKFPEVRITSTPEVVDELANEGIKATSEASEGIVFFDAPHEDVKPLFPQPEEVGIHYLDSLTDPGDSHTFTETKAILALPMTAPWGSNIKALNLALELKPKHILPIHDWHWSDAAREQTYGMWQDRLQKEGITFHPLKTGEPVEIEIL